MSSVCSSNVTSGFIDLATFDEIEKYMYGGPDATAYFVRETRKSTWFTMVPVVLNTRSSTPAFNQDWSVTISRAGDYLLQTWLRLTTPQVCLGANNQWGYAGRLRWTRNFMHNIIKDCAITFNDLVAARFDNYFLDFWTAFTVPEGKKAAYANMIGNVPDLTLPHCVGDVIPSRVLNLPLPFWYSRDSGVALPTAALPYNEMRINFTFRDWKDLLILDFAGNVTRNSTGTLNITPVYAGAGYTNQTVSAPAAGFPWSVPVCNLSWLGSNTVPTLGNTQVWANYAIVSNDERKRMACAPRDILIEQCQNVSKQAFMPTSNTRYDIRFSHAIKVLFFGVRNTTNSSEWSNYTTASPYVIPQAAITGEPGYNTGLSCDQSMNRQSIDFSPEGSYDPIGNTSLVYENTQRLSMMGSDYFSLINPYYHAASIPTETGYHVYSYSLDFLSLDPMGSTNYGKLTNVTIAPEASDAAIVASSIQTSTPCGGSPSATCDSSSGCSGSGCCTANCTYVCPSSGLATKQTFDFICCAVNNNIIRISGGALGFPVL
jgi:hypothetical protein